MGLTWTVSVSGGNTSSEDLDGGIIHIQSGGAATQYARVREPAKSFVVELDKQLWFATTVEPQTDINNMFVLGLQDGTGSDDPFVARSGIYFRSISGTFDIELVSNNGGTETTLLVSTIDYTLVKLKLGYYFAGKDNIKAYIDDNFVGILQQPNLPTVPIGVILASQTAVADPKDIHIDYVFAAKER
jgi:hypothetical protein